MVLFYWSKSDTYRETHFSDWWLANQSYITWKLMT